jgi:hypothetical protein
MAMIRKVIRAKKARQADSNGRSSLRQVGCV